MILLFVEYCFLHFLIQKKLNKDFHPLMLVLNLIRFKLQKVLTYYLFQFLVIYYFVFVKIFFLLETFV